MGGLSKRATLAIAIALVFGPAASVGSAGAATKTPPPPSGGTKTTTPACADGRDNDGDGLADTADPGCASSADTTEINRDGPACDNGQDDDLDGAFDFGGGSSSKRPPDPGCTGPTDTDETDPPTERTLSCVTPTTDTQYPTGDVADDAASQYDFGGVYRGETPQVIVTCTASGPPGSQVTIDSVAISGEPDNTPYRYPDGGFSDPNALTCFRDRNPLSPGESCQFPFSFHSDVVTTADFYKALITVGHDGANSPAEVHLEGTGLGEPPS
jgi:hypothetical protein